MFMIVRVREGKKEVGRKKRTGAVFPVKLGNKLFISNSLKCTLKEMQCHSVLGWVRSGATYPDVPTV